MAVRGIWTVCELVLDTAWCLSAPPSGVALSVNLQSTRACMGHGIRQILLIFCGLGLMLGKVSVLSLACLFCLMMIASQFVGASAYQCVHMA